MTTQPAGKINLDLDTLEKEKDEVKEPFVFVVDGREITMVDAADIDWQDLMQIENPVQFFRFAISKEDREFLVEQKLPGWKIGKLTEAYMKHYGLGEPKNGRASLI